MNPDLNIDWEALNKSIEEFRKAVEQIDYVAKDTEAIKKLAKPQFKGPNTAQRVQSEVGTHRFDTLQVEPSLSYEGGVRITIGEVNTVNSKWQHLDAQELADLITVLMYIKQRTEEINNGN